MKKKPEPFSTIVSPGKVVYTTNYIVTKKTFKRPDPPSDETIRRLNDIVKEAPFCFHFQSRKNDFL
jgi:hypothetical protein